MRKQDRWWLPPHRLLSAMDGHLDGMGTPQAVQTHGLTAVTAQRARESAEKCPWEARGS